MYIRICHLYTLFNVSGPHLQSLRYKRIQYLCLRARRILIENDYLTPMIRYRLLEIIELSQNRWEGEALPVEVTKLYSELQLNIKATAVTAGQRTERQRRDSNYSVQLVNIWALL